jgi:alpha-beta hydrolase superfamily lysophospholipase
VIRREGTTPPLSGSIIHYQQWLPDTAEPRAIIAIVHGFGEYTGLYAQAAEFFVERGLAVFAGDLRGHGQSPGPRGFIREWKDFRQDVQSLIQVVRGEFPSTPVFLLGNSLGGLIAAEYAQHHQDRLRGLILLSPALGKIGVARVLLWLSRMLSRIWPSFSLDTGMDAGAMTRDRAAAARLDADPMVHGRGSARLGTEVQDTIVRVREAAGRLTLPLLIAHGDADTITDAADSQWFTEQVGARDKELRIYRGSYHNLTVDLNWREVLADVDQWISRVLRSER